MEKNQNPSLRFSKYTIHALSLLRSFKNHRRQIQDDEIMALIDGHYLTKEQLENQITNEQFLKETETLRARTQYPERIWKLLGSEIDVFIFDLGNGWSRIIAIRDKKGNEL